MEVDQGDGEDSSVKKTPEEQGWKTIHARNKKNRATDADTQPGRQGDAASADAEDHKRRASRNIEKMNAAPKKPQHLPKKKTSRSLSDPKMDLTQLDTALLR
ncbi:hypothetical protein MTO96_045093 [Rhipicephalus appendiculatus]